MYGQGMLRAASPLWDRDTIITKHLLNVNNVSDLRLGSGMQRGTTVSSLECSSPLSLPSPSL